MKICFIATVYNEEKNIEMLIDSLLSQSLLPDEIIIVDGGSSDKTVAKIKNHTFGKLSTRKSKIKKYEGRFLHLIKRGNRSVGRNEAVRNSTGDIIVCSDAGCILDKDWVQNITGPFKQGNVDVVAGYYKGRAANILQKCLVPYVLVMPDKVNPDNFLPAARSMAFKKTVWEKVNGFPEEFSHNEDYVFAKRIKKMGFNIKLEKRAIIEWIPPTSLYASFFMFMRFALGDMEAGILRPKVIFIFIRYLIAILALFYAIINTDATWILGIVTFFVIYIIWAACKNYKYVSVPKAVVILPAIQVLSDVAVITGTSVGLIKYGIQK